MTKRARLEIIRDILNLIANSHSIRFTPLLRRSGLSSAGFKEYYLDLLKREMIKETTSKEGKRISITEKGSKFIEKYKSIVDFIEEFEL